MRRVETDCPTCGASVVFKVSSSLVTVCDHCQSVVARGDAKLEDYGKVARVASVSSPINLYTLGLYRNKSFEVVGRVSYNHSGGGRWDEWYAAFPGDRWGWMSEAQGAIHVLFKEKLADDVKLPAFDEIVVGQALEIQGKSQWKVMEIGDATIRGAEGELPFTIRQSQSHRYVDMVGEEQAFATLEYNPAGEVTLYVGAEVSLQDLGLSDTSVAPDSETTKITSREVSCPNCAGTLALRAPDQTERVVCPFCSSLLDTTQGNVAYLETLKGRPGELPVIPIGQTGRLNGQRYTVIGFMRRSVTYELTYFWSEYLLYNTETRAFRWLVHCDNHWSFVWPVSAATCNSPGQYDHAIDCDGKTYRLFERASATVRYVLGEFYWKVSVGEVVETADYIRPPYSLSVETTSHASTIEGQQRKSTETTYSLGKYLPHAVLDKAFPLPVAARRRLLRRGWGVAPTQPNHIDLRTIWLSWLCTVAALVVVFWSALHVRLYGDPDASWFVFSIVIVTLIPAGATVYSNSFERKRWEDSDYSPYSVN